MHGQAFSQCTACSPAVLDAYRQRGWAFLEEAVWNPVTLEALTGLDKLHAEAAAWEARSESGGGGSEPGGGGSGAEDDWHEL